MSEVLARRRSMKGRAGELVTSHRSYGAEFPIPSLEIHFKVDSKTTDLIALDPFTADFQSFLDEIDE